MSDGITQTIEPFTDDHDVNPPDDTDADDDSGDGDGRTRWTTVATFDTSAAAHVARLRLESIACSLHWVFGGLLLGTCVFLIVRSSGWRCDDCANQSDIRRGFTMIPTARLARPDEARH